MGFKHEFQRCEKAFKVPRMIYFLDLAAKAVAVHAAVQEGAANDFPGPFTNPAIPRSVEVAFAAGWQGGDIYIRGTDQFNRFQAETIADAAGTTVAGVKIWKTITAVAKELIAGTTDTCTLQTGAKIGLLNFLVDSVAVLICGVAPEAATMDTTYHAFTPTSTPNGTLDFTLLYHGRSNKS